MLQALVQGTQALARHLLLPVFAQCVFPKRRHTQRYINHRIKFFVGKVFGNTLWYVNAILGYHLVKLAYTFGVKLFEVVEDNTIADAMFGAQQIAKSVAYRMGYAHLRISNAHTTSIGCHHQLFIAFFCPFIVVEEYLLAQQAKVASGPRPAGKELGL